MKNIGLTLLFCLLISMGYSKEKDEKTFLVIFNKAELKAQKTSTAYIELSLMNLFQTRSYAGNSDAAIIVKIPNSSMDKCQLGDFIIRINPNKVSPLDDIAFKIYDLDESKEVYQQMISSFEGKNQKAQKNSKSALSIF